MPLPEDGSLSEGNDTAHKGGELMQAPYISLQELRRVVVAAAVGNVIEWYDFYIFGSLASILAVKFFEKSHPVAAFLSTIALFSIGFLIRPLGALVFGWLGDKVGRKYTFLVTLSGMGLSTAVIGIIPTYAQIGLAAAVILFVLRLIQGLCLGGEYGGAITYVAEHIADEKRGYYTGWLQTSPTLGIVLSLAVIISTRTYLGSEAFNDWGWRIPFIISLLLVAVAIYIRLSLQETPIFQDIKAKGQTATNPWREAFLSRNIKYVLIACVVVLGQGCVWYSGQFWALYFLQTVKKIDVLTSSYIVGLALLIATPTLVFWGWLSDKIGRKPIILGGMLLASLTYYPLYVALGNYADPANMNYVMSVLIVAVLVNYVGMTYGPIAAFLAEFFPGRIRYTSVSVPYHIGNGWGGGLVPIITTSVYLSTNSLGWALVYPIGLPLIMFVIAVFVMPETRQHSIWEEGAIEATRA
jgi:MFS family permease